MESWENDTFLFNKNKREELHVQTYKSLTTRSKTEPTVKYILGKQRPKNTDFAAKN